MFRLRSWLTSHRFLLIRLFWLGQLILALTIIICSVYPPLQNLWPKFGRLLANLSVIFFCLTVLPGILKRFQVGGFLQNIQLILLIFRRQLGIAMYLFALYHYLFSRLFPTLKFHGNLFALSTFELVGMAAFLLTLPLFLTSNNWSQLKLGPNWRRLHRLVYLIIWITLIHIILQSKFGPITILLAVTAILEIASFFKGFLAAVIASLLTLSFAYLIFAKPSFNANSVPIVPPAPTANSPTLGQLNPPSPYTLETISAHRTAADCWTVIEAKVYNLSTYIPFHPGGQETILSACGTDATTNFNTKGGRGRPHLSSTKTILSQYYLADLNAPAASSSALLISPTISPALTPPATNKSTSPTSSTLNTTEVQKHNSQADCWIIVSNQVYNVTAYIPFHPGGTQRIVNTCGTDATTAFNTRGGSGSHSTNAHNLLNNYYLGNFNATTTGGGTAPTVTPAAGGSVSSPQAAILAQYPGAAISEVDHEDWGYQVHFTYQGREYEAKLNQSYVITSVQ